VSSFTGKLISPRIYDKLETIILDEYSMFLKDQGLNPTTSPQLTLFDEKFIVGVNLTCQDCRVLYQNEIRQKIGILAVSCQSVVKTTLLASFSEQLLLNYFRKHATIRLWLIFTMS
jgi:hypothetical protein